MPIVDYKSINQGHSVGMELEYCVVLKDGKPYRCVESLVEEITKKRNLHGGVNHPKVYADGGLLELCSSPQVSIADLYEQMQELHQTMNSVLGERNLQTIPKAYYFQPKRKAKEKDRGSAKECLAGEFISGAHVHVGRGNMIQKHLLYAALKPFLPLFTALANNSPSYRYPHGSERLREGMWGKDLTAYDRKAQPILIHTIAPTIEVRCMDRAATLEEDVAHAALVYATAEYLKKDLRNFSLTSIFNREKISAYYIKKTYGAKPEFGSSAFLNYALHQVMHFGTKSTVEVDENTVASIQKALERHYLSIREELAEIRTPSSIVKMLDEKIFLAGG